MSMNDGNTQHATLTISGDLLDILKTIGVEDEENIKTVVDAFNDFSTRMVDGTESSNASVALLTMVMTQMWLESSCPSPSAAAAVMAAAVTGAGENMQTPAYERAWERMSNAISDILQSIADEEPGEGPALQLVDDPSIH